MLPGRVGLDQVGSSSWAIPIASASHPLPSSPPPQNYYIEFQGQTRDKRAFFFYKIRFDRQLLLQEAFFTWLKGLHKRQRCTLIAWAIDQNNRKVYEVERAMLSENSWILRSPLWDGFLQSPLFGIMKQPSASQVGQAAGSASRLSLIESLKVFP